MTRLLDYLTLVPYFLLGAMAGLPVVACVAPEAVHVVPSEKVEASSGRGGEASSVACGAR